MQFDFLELLVFIDFRLVVILLVVGGSKRFLSTPPSRPGHTKFL